MELMELIFKKLKFDWGFTWIDICINDDLGGSE